MTDTVTLLSGEDVTLALAVCITDEETELREVNLTFLVTQLDNSRTGTWSHGPNVAQTLLGIGEEDNECARDWGGQRPRPKPIVCVWGSHLLNFQTVP